ncbi:ABC transporter permease [Halorussus litoreus]|uniref:ABC transporter permease n=1 Tax=Halorussus litoreus TaxID=1710536 RepID=UPI000E2292E9|nr:ABC transporter permease [Halorussus litoreus]
MNWLTIAKKDFRDARRSKILWGALLIFNVFIVAVLGTNSTDPGGPYSAAQVGMSTMVGVGMFFLPLIMLVIAYLSITGEQESGSIKYLLGLPNTRLDVLVGKLVGRTAVAMLGIGVALVVGALIMSVRFDEVPVGQYAGFSLMILYFTAVYVAIAVGVSALCRTRARALAGTLGVYFVFSVLWIFPSFNPQTAVSYVVEDLLGLAAMPRLYDLILHLSPSYAFSIANYELVLDMTRGGYMGTYVDGFPFYLQGWFMLVILLAWFVAPLAIGYARFRKAELS